MLFKCKGEGCNHTTRTQPSKLKDPDNYMCQACRIKQRSQKKKDYTFHRKINAYATTRKKLQELNQENKSEKY